MTGIDFITAERQEQPTKHGHTVAKDVEDNAQGQLIDAALALLEDNPFAVTPINWDKAFFDRMNAKTYDERLIISAALIAAEIDRLITKFPDIKQKLLNKYALPNSQE